MRSMTQPVAQIENCLRAGRQIFPLWIALRSTYLARCDAGNSPFLPTHQIASNHSK